jgi:hypothetical protein
VAEIHGFRERHFGRKQKEEVAISLKPKVVKGLA